MLKFFKILILTAFLFLLVTQVAFAKDEVNFVSYDKAFEIAKEKGKPIFIYFYMPACGYCNRFSSTVFNKDNIIKLLNDNFVTVKIDLNDDSFNVGSKYKIQQVPAYWFLEPDGTSIDGLIGFRDYEPFGATLLFIQSGLYKNMKLNDYLELLKK